VPTLTATQIYQVCLTAGFTPDQAVTWTAIALAESGGNTDAHNPRGEDSWGLWQINVDPGVRPNHWGDLTDPVTNARAALEVSGGGTNLRPWTVTHASNAGTAHDYRAFMDEARAAAGGAHMGDFSGVTGYDDPLPGGTGDDQRGGVTAVAPAPAATVVPEADTDLDGAPDSFEMSRGTDPRSADSEVDGLTDGFEAFLGTDGTDVDTDDDGLSDAYEVELGINPLQADSDSDTVSDALEVASGADPNIGMAPGTPGADVDSDTDGLSDGLETSIGTNPHAADTDADHLADALEIARGTDPLLADSDRDGILDEVDADPTAPFAGLMPPGGGLPLAGAAPIALAAGAAAPPEVAEAGGAEGDRVRQFLDLALAQTGDSYVFGSEAPTSDVDPDVFDCSELVQWAGGRLGVELPDGSWLQYLALQERGALVPVEQAVNTPGALLFSFDTEPTPGGGRPGSAHVAISLGDGTTIEARGTRYGVGSWETGDRFQYAAVIPELGGDLGAGAVAALADPLADPLAAGAGVPAGPAIPAGPDTDGDGAPDDFEMSRGLDPALPDSDDDGLADGFELTIGTDALAVDSDHDMLSDAFEVQARLNPLSPDSDGDGMTDAYELASTGEVGPAPFLASAGDPATAGLPGTGPPGAGIPGAAPGADALDTDHDGLSDAWESTLGTDPLSRDSDDDGLTDALEVARGTDPLVHDDVDDDLVDR
jgi:cell wall-associated NlpC family hydrolase